MKDAEKIGGDKVKQKLGDKAGSRFIAVTGYDAAPGATGDPLNGSLD